MAGHSHWAGIKHKKEATDHKRGRVFSKLCAAITVAARGESNPDFNPRLRTAIEKAKENKVPADNIVRAIARATETGESLDELILEAYGPGGTALIIEAVSDNRNRTIPEIKKVLNDHNGKWAEQGSVRWAFEGSLGSGWVAKFTQSLGSSDMESLKSLIDAIEEHDDVQKVFTNGILAQ
jgi:YebC/PmpR family DNA-binding regulatory protein